MDNEKQLPWEGTFSIYDLRAKGFVWNFIESQYCVYSTLGLAQRAARKLAKKHYEELGYTDRWENRDIPWQTAFSAAFYQIRKGRQ